MEKVKLVLQLFCATCLLSFCAKSQEQPANGIEGNLREAMDELEEEGFSGSVLVGNEGTILFSEGYGYANKEEAVPAKPFTLYDIGSITKDFTKVAVLKLVERNKISLEDPIAHFFPHAPADKKEITIKQLLYHTSGLGDYHDTKGDFEKMTKQEALAAIFQQPLPFKAGSQISYSNSGYTLLAAIIEKVTDQPFTDYIKKEVIEPCRLQKMDFYQSQQWSPEEVAVGYEAKEMGNINSPYYWPRVGWALMGSGGLVSSTEEFYQWLTCLNSGKIISKEMVKKHFDLYNSVAGSNDFGFHTISLQRDNGQTLVVFSNGNNEVVQVVMRLIPVLDKANPFPDHPEREEEIEKRVEAMLQALKIDDKEGIPSFVQEHVNSAMLEQIPAEALAVELSKIRTHVGKEMALEDLQKLEHSIYHVLLKNPHSGNTASVLLQVEPAAPFKFNALSPKIGGAEGEVNQAVELETENTSNPWGLPADNALASVLVELFKAYEKGSDEAIVAFVNHQLGDQIKNGFPLEAHLKYLKTVKEKLGKNFRVEKIRQKGKTALQLEVRAGDGEKYLLHMQADSKDKQKLGGLQVSKK